MKLWIFRIAKELTLVLKTLFLLFPSVIFLCLVWQCCWKLSQGKDIAMAIFEKQHVAGIFLLAFVFYVLITWYTGRILVYRKKEISRYLLTDYSPETSSSETGKEKVQDHYSGSLIGQPFYLQVVFNLPRFFGFLAFAIVWISFLQLPLLRETTFHFNASPGWLMLLNVVAYYILYLISTRIRNRYLEKGIGKLEREISALHNDDDPSASTSIYMKKAQIDNERKNADGKRKLILSVFFIILFLAIILNTLITNPWLILISLLVLQFLFPFFVVLRLDKASLKQLPLFSFDSYKDWLRYNNINTNPLHWLMYHANIPLTEKGFFINFNVFSIMAFVFYMVTINSFSFSVWLGSYPFIFLAFGVVLGFLALVSIVSVAMEINIYFFLLVVAVIVGLIPSLEPHNVQLTDTVDSSYVLKTRPTLHAYFSSWVKRNEEAIKRDSSFPVYFVLADGGASRSGYWVASVLGSLQDETHGKFSDHLFALSGASGGSVGNAGFFALLKEKESMSRQKKKFVTTSQQFLRTDFLTYTLARMLGPDILRFLFPLQKVNDRAAALEFAIESGVTDKDNVLFKKMETPMSDLIRFGNSHAELPILCINATRMQDGRPGVISTIQLQDSIFGKRIDILANLPEGKDLKLSTSVVLGARFPYLSPAGRIDHVNSMGKKEISYYVDGGYFDNSGAGVIHEMIISLQRIISDSINKIPGHYLKHLEFYVIHAMNSPLGNPVLEKIHPLKNDLISPFITLVGSFSTQTTVNDLRLQKYLEDLNHKKPSYFKVNLYEGAEILEDFPMNWTISNYYRNKMDKRLKTNKTLQLLIHQMNQ